MNKLINRKSERIYIQTASPTDFRVALQTIEVTKRLLFFSVTMQVFMFIMLGYLASDAWTRSNAEHDTDVYLVAILRQAQIYGTVSRKMHNRPFPLMDPEIKFSSEDIVMGLVPSPYPGTLPQLREATIEWMTRFRMPCAAPGGFTAPLSFAVLPDHYVMLNLRLFLNETLSKHVSRSAIEEKSPTQESTRVVSRYDEVYLSHLSIDGQAQPDSQISGEIAYCLQMFFSVHDEDNKPFTHDVLQEL
jgi:hypothetical protein